jgi:formyl-CoA transferase
MGALAGLRVLDISTFLAAPQISAILGDFGADVIKIEPPAGEASRKIGAQRHGASLMWALTSRNKRTITLDLNHERGREVFRALADRADVVVENYPAAQLAEWGLSYDDLSARNPGLVMVSVSCYGNTGPLADRPGAGTLAEAYGGLTFMTGEADGPPMLPSIPLGDSLSALSGVIGTLVACYHNKVNGGGGQHVDVSFYEPVLTLMQPTIIAYDEAAGEPAPMRTGSRIPTGVPRNVYRTGDDRWLVLSGTTDRQVARILKIIGADTPEGRAKFAASPDRIANADELDALVAAWIATHTLVDVLDVMTANRVPAAPVNDVPSLLRDDHIRARGSIVTVDDAAVGAVHMVPAAPRLEATPAAIRFAGPPIGAYNEEVYREWLGYDEATLDELRATGAI